VILLPDQKRATEDPALNESVVLSAAEITARFGEMTNSGRLSKRDAADALATATGKTRKEIYRILREADCLG
jgi:hypothetical protein